MLDAALSLNRKKRGRPRRSAPPDLKEMRIQGLSFRAIARKTGLGYGTVRRLYWASERVTAVAAD